MDTRVFAGALAQTHLIVKALRCLPELDLPRPLGEGERVQRVRRCVVGLAVLLGAEAVEGYAVELAEDALNFRVWAVGLQQLQHPVVEQHDVFEPLVEVGWACCVCIHSSRCAHE